MTFEGLEPCCEDFRSALEVTMINPIDGATGWLLYGTDSETVSAGQPELRYWPIKYCPFCGAELARPPPGMLRRARRFGVE